MKRTIVRFKNSAFRDFFRRHSKYAPIVFFISGFIFDTLTLGRIDRTYDLTVLCLHMTSLSITLSFFIILVLLLIANEFLKKRISNKYLQFGVYYFISFTFFTFMIPVFLKELNTTIFLISGAASLAITLVLLIFIYVRSQSTRKEINLGKMIIIILSIYGIINLFYFLKLIPPVPLALDKGIVAHNITMKDDSYLVSYEPEDSFVFWRKHKLDFAYVPDESVYIFSSIFAPTDLSKAVFHRWKWYNENTKEWEITEDIGYKITGGRDGGFRGYTYKNNVKPGEWEVQVLTDEEHVLGVIKFEIKEHLTGEPVGLKTEQF